MSERPESYKVVIAIAACVGIFVSWQNYLTHKYPTMNSKTVGQKNQPKAATPVGDQKNQVEKPSEADVTKNSAEIKTGSGTLDVRSPEEFWTYEDDQIKVSVSNVGGRISEVTLKGYRDQENHPVQLVRGETPGVLVLSVDGSKTYEGLDQARFRFTEKGLDFIKMELTGPGFTVRREYKYNKNKFSLNTMSEIIGNLVLGNVVKISNTYKQDKMGSSGFFGGGGAFGGEIFTRYGNEKESREWLTPDKSLEAKDFDKVRATSVGSRYFSAAFFNKSNVLPKGKVYSHLDLLHTELAFEVMDSHAPVTIVGDLYLGPKSLSILKGLGDDATALVDFGMFRWLALPLLALLKWFYSLMGNWGASIIAITILMRLVTFPFNYMSYKSMKGMQKLQPEMNRIREIYKNDTQKQNAEVMKLMREHKVNPMGGCLPILLQMPVFFALYAVLQNSIELYKAPVGLWIVDLSAKDPLFVLPILMGLSMFIQQKITPTTMDPAQARVMLFMPVIFSFLMFSLPSGLTLYMFVSTVFGVAQQYIMLHDNRTENRQAVVRKA